MRLPFPAPTRLAAPLLLLGAFAAPAAAGETRLLRYPDIHGDRIVFTYAGDLWTASTAGGAASRLTAHPGIEMFARFSPDGRHLAFTGQYDGDEQVYVMPSEGGPPVQLTFYPAAGPLPTRWGYDNLVYDWSPDGERILFRSLRDGHGVGDGRLYEVPRGGGLPAALPMPRAGSGAYAPDGGRLVYSPLFRDFRAWKRYAGGWAQDLYLFDRETREVTRITDHARSDRDPMWIGREIFFTSDRSGTNDLYSYDTETGETRRRTQSDPWDVRWPGADASGRIVFERGGALHLLDTRSDEAPRPIPLTVPTDGLASRPSRVSAAGQVEHGGSPRPGNGPSSPPAARSSRRRSRTGPPATSPGRPAPTRSGRPGLPTAAGSPSSPTRAAKRRSTSSRRAAASRRSDSPSAAGRCATGRSGRPTAAGSPSPTRREPSASWKWRPAKS